MEKTNKRIENKGYVEKRLVDLNEFADYTGLGKNSARKLGSEIGCVVRIGRRVLFDLKKADCYFDSLD